MYEVVVPTYNVERTIADTLESLGRQSLPPARILIADDESPDSSVEIASRYPRVEILSFPHSGLSGVQNRALAHVRSEFVAYVDGDDVWHPRAGESLLEALRRTGAAAVSLAAEPFADGTLPRFRDPGPPGWTGLSYADLLGKTPIQKSGTMYRTESIRAVGGWHEDLVIAGDRDIALRLMEAGWEIHSTAWRGLGLRRSPSGLSRSPARALVEQLRVLLPRFPAAFGHPSGVSRYARALWFRALARAAEDGRDLRDVPNLTDLVGQTPAGQRALELLVRSPLRHAIAAGWRTWRSDWAHIGAVAHFWR